MAKFVTEKFTDGTQVRLLIDHSVGLRGRNRRDDVQLVQLMLNAANHYLKSFFKGPLPAELKVDGICGKKTLAAIRAYQENVNKAWPNTLVEDGTINATNKDIFRKGGTDYTAAMKHLNFFFGKELSKNLFVHMKKAWGAQPLTDSILKPLANFLA